LTKYRNFTELSAKTHSRSKSKTFLAKISCGGKQSVKFVDRLYILFTTVFRGVCGGQTMSSVMCSSAVMSPFDSVH